MGLLGFERVVFVCALMSVLIGLVVGNVLLIGKNVSLSFNDIEANFSPAIKGSGESGILYLADPPNACTSLKNKVVEGPESPFALIIRGDCTFDDKVKNAQNAGFKSAVVYDNEEHGALVAMAGTAGGIHIHAVFVSKASGETLKSYAGCTDVELWIIPTFENSAWSIIAISFISLLAMSAVLATCFFVRRHRIRREQPRASNVREFHGMSSRIVKAMPSLIFTSVLEDNSTSVTCAICLEDYIVGEKLRILPCRHKFHSLCVDSWLTTWRTFCPVCKQDARTGMSNPPPSECTPLLSSAASTPTSSFHSSVATSPPIQINLGPAPEAPPRSPLTNRTHSLASSLPRMPNPGRYSDNSASISTSRSFMDVRHASYNGSRASFHSLVCPQSSSINTRFMSPYVQSPGNGSPSYVGDSSSRHNSYHLRHCSNSRISLSAMDSARSLPEC